MADVGGSASAKIFSNFVKITGKTLKNWAETKTEKQTHPMSSLKLKKYALRNEKTVPT